jgi:hypothetical protein
MTSNQRLHLIAAACLMLRPSKVNPWARLEAARRLLEMAGAPPTPVSKKTSMEPNPLVTKLCARSASANPFCH